MTSQTIYILSGIALFIAALIGNLIYTDHELKKKSVISHWHDWEIKCISCLPAIFFFGIALDNVKWFIYGLPFLMSAAWFWTFFDGIFGLSVAHDFFYTGTATGKNAANSDKILRSIPTFLQAILKISSCVITAYLYIKMIEK